MFALTLPNSKEEEKRPKWQPPAKPDSTSKGPAPNCPGSTTISSPAKGISNSYQNSSKENRCASPMKAAASPAKAILGHAEVISSPKKTQAPPVPHDKAPGSPASALSRNSPLRSSKVCFFLTHFLFSLKCKPAKERQILIN